RARRSRLRLGGAHRRAGWSRGRRGRALAGVVRSCGAGLDRRRRPPAAAARRPRCELSWGSPRKRRAPRGDENLCYLSCRIDLLPIIPVAQVPGRDALIRGPTPPAHLALRPDAPLSHRGEGCKGRQPSRTLIPPPPCGEGLGVGVPGRDALIRGPTPPAHLALRPDAPPSPSRGGLQGPPAVTHP